MQSVPLEKNDLVTKAIHYQDKVAAQATKLLAQLFLAMPNSLKRLTSVNVLVIGAGMFPSFNAFMQQLATRMPNLTDVKLTLVEPHGEALDLFSEHFSRPVYNDKIQIQYDFKKEDVKDFLQSSPPNVFEIVYLEHPDTHILPILPAKLGIKRFAATLSLREAMPLMKNVVKTESLLLASCMSRQEVNQLKRLLQFSLSISTFSCSSASIFKYFYAGPYTSGLYSILCLPPDKKELPERVKQIRRSDNGFCFALVFSLLFYFVGAFQPDHGVQRFLSVMLLLLLVLLHQPGRKGRVIRWVIMGFMVLLSV